MIRHIQRENLFKNKQKKKTLKPLNIKAFGNVWIQKEIKIYQIKLSKRKNLKFNLKKKILIVGGTGFLGEYLQKKCLLKNFEVTVLSSSKKKTKKKN